MTEPQLWVSVAESGTFYALIALAYLLILDGAGFFNFAIGPYAMVAALGASWLVVEKDFSLLPAVAIGVVLVLALSAATEVVIIRRIQSRSSGSELPALVAVAAIVFAIQQAAGLTFGRRPLRGQRLVTFERFKLGDAIIQPTSVVLVGVTLALFGAVAVWIKTTPAGRTLRAVGDNSGAARLLGLPVGRVRLVAFLLAGFIAAAAGLLFAPKAGVSFDRGLRWTVNGFLALVVGGTGSTWAPLLGGFVLAGTQVFVPYYLGGAATDYATLVLALVFFAFRPQGVFTRRVRA